MRLLQIFILGAVLALPSSSFGDGGGSSRLTCVNCSDSISKLKEEIEADIDALYQQLDAFYGELEDLESATGLQLD
ncbi:MAG: hypothetical protein EA369_09175 [Bradymonadales bacterium]|nr:MAG: hypothetical protein EA369_09175 [Bradymonadales bacterium]